MKQLVAIAVLFLLYSCGNNDISPIQGTAAGMPDGTELYLEELGSNNKRVAVDTALVTAEKFTFQKPITDGTGILILSQGKPNNQLLLVKDAKPLTVELYKDSLGASIVTGSLENELFNSYRNSARQTAVKKQQYIKEMQKAQRETDGVMVTLMREKISDIDEQFIVDKKAVVENNTDKMVSIIALSDLINAKVLKVEESDAYFQSLSKEIQDSPIGESVENYIAQLKSQRIASALASVGNKAPEFSAKTPEGKELALSDALGKYTIIDFWASWCRPCRMENPNVVNVYNQYHDKGLNIISVSLDRPGQDARWKKAIKDDKMDWYHVSNLNYWQDPIPRSYGVRAIPATFLLDENGVIIAKDLRGSALGAKMKELLGDS
ncbi:TlpA disulfide reductase family protein [uncultured Dokdonia sp.]|uniref:TlpA disulfide reductase family protein n=1 Tax=uncultured Dokdonia sp. TaxID=575653 RepID=UPI00263388F5|nr:TlpA disulfide reductase family protein [uncultured Dokdonia sp.]